MERAKVSMFLRRRREISLVSALTLLWLVIATVPAARAQEPGVVYEPGSPSGKEYAIPLQEARRDAGGGRPGKLEALPFGIGLSRQVAARAAGSRRGEAQGTGRRRAGERRGGGARGTQSRGVREGLADAEDAGAPLLWRLGPLLLVLLPALLVGLLLARRDQQQPAT